MALSLPYAPHGAFSYPAIFAQSRAWFDDAECEATARSFENPDWLAIMLNSYRSGWRDEPRDDGLRVHV